MDARYDIQPTTTPYLSEVPSVVRQVVDDQAELYLDGVKGRLGMTGIVDYDMALVDLIRVAIAAVEDYTGLALQSQTVTATYERYAGDRLPFGPVWPDLTVTVVTKSPGSTIRVTDTTGQYVGLGEFPHMQGRFANGSVSYKAGYARNKQQAGSTDPEYPFVMPLNLVGAIEEHAAETYRTGGLSGGTPGGRWKVLASTSRNLS